MRVCARVVLVCYLTQTLAPVIHASELMMRPQMDHSFDKRLPMSGAVLKPNPKLMAKDETPKLTSISTEPHNIVLPSNRPLQPSETDRKKAASIIENYWQTSAVGSYVNPQADAFQYRLSIKTRNATREQFDLKLSRKAKGAEGKFERLHTASLNQGTLLTKSKSNTDDIFLNLLRGGSVTKCMSEGKTDNYSWNIAGIGLIEIKNDGSVVLKGDDSTPILSNYNLVLKTSRDMTIEYLDTAALSLASYKGKENSHQTALGIVATNSLYTDHKTINKGALTVHQEITGSGKLINHGGIQIGGTAQNPAIFGIREFENRKHIEHLKPIVEAQHLQITSDNKRFYNGKDAEFSITDSLTVDASGPQSTFINKGTFKAGRNIALDREAINYAFWQATHMTVNKAKFTNKEDLKILDELTINSQLQNEGEVKVKNSLLGSGTFHNSNKLMFDGVNHSLVLQEFHNKKQGTITANGPAQSKVSRFVNDGMLQTHGISMIQPSAEFTNNGIWKNTGRVHTRLAKLSNTGTLDWRNGSWTFENQLTIQARHQKMIQKRQKQQDLRKHFGTQLPMEDTFPPVDFTNNGIWILDNIAYTSKLVMHNHGTIHLKNASYNFWELNNHKDVLASIDLASTLTIQKGISRGKLSAPNHSLNIHKSFTNEGEATIHNLEGEGKFNNSGTLQLSGSAYNPSQLTIQEIQNQRTGKIIAACPSESTVKLFVNDGTLQTHGFKMTQPIARFDNTGTWENIGNINTGSTKLSNTGRFEWRNGKWEFALHVPHRDCSSMNSKERNAFVYKVRTGSLQSTINSGPPPLQFTNNGTWIFDNISCSHNISMTNHGTFGLMGGSLNFWDFVNHKDLVFSAGQYTVANKLENHKLLGLKDNDWTITDDATHQSQNRLVLKEAALKNFVVRGNIEAEKSVAYDLQPLPNLLKASDNITFSPRHRQLRQIDDLYNIESGGKVLFYCPAVVPNRIYNFEKIDHLSLDIDGFFRNNFEFTAPTLSINTTAAFQCGENNERKGKVAATHGPLNIKASCVDTKFGQVYGKGQTVIKSTAGNISVGSPKQGYEEEFKEYFLSQINILFPQAVEAYIIKYGYTAEHMLHNLHKCNKTYVSSGDHLTLDSANDIFMDSGNVFGGKGTTLKAAKDIKNIAGKIRSLGPTNIQAISYEHTTKPTKQEYYHLASSSYDMPVSGPAFLSSLGDINFNVQKILSRGSTIRTQGKFFVNGIPSQKQGEKEILPLYIEEPMDCYCYTFWGGAAAVPRLYFSQPCILQSAKAIHINSGYGEISGSKNSPFISIDVNGDLRIRGINGQYRQNSQSGLFDLTESIQVAADNDSLLRLTDSREVQTVFPIGTPYRQQARRIFLQPSDRSLHIHHPYNFLPRINPLGSLSFDFLNLQIQHILGHRTGKVYIKGSKGDNLKALTDHAEDFYNRTGKEVVTLEELQQSKLAHSMLLWGLKQVGQLSYDHMILYIAPEDSDTEIGTTGNDINIHATGNIDIEGANIVAEDNLTIISEQELGLLSILGRAFHPHGYHDFIDKEARLIAKKGNATVLGKQGFKMKGATIRAFLNLIAGSTEGRTVIEDMTLHHITTHTHHEEGGLLGGDKTTQITTDTASLVPSTLESQNANQTIISGDNEKISITGSELKALLALILQGGEVETNAGVGIGSTSTTIETHGAYSSTKSISSQQTATINPTVLKAHQIFTDTKKASYRGTDFIADVLSDGTKDGMYLGPTVAMLEYFQQHTSESPMAISDVGCKGGQEVMQPCRLMVNEVIRAIDEGQIKLNFTDITDASNRSEQTITLTEDGTQRIVKQMPGTDNACGFYSMLTGHPDFTTGVNPRQLAVQKLLEGLENSNLQTEICNLLAPEILELYINKSLKFIPGAKKLLKDNKRNAETLRHALAEAKDNLGLQDTAYDVDYILKLIPEGFDNDEGSLHSAKRAMDAQKTQEIEWATKKETVAAFIQGIVGRPGWELGYSSDIYNRIHEGETTHKPSGVMDALALVLGANLKIYRKHPEIGATNLRLVHEKTVPAATRTIELFHHAYKEDLSNNEKEESKKSAANHFDLLEVVTSENVTSTNAQTSEQKDTGVVKLESVVWDKDRTKFLCDFAETTYQLKQCHTSWANVEQAVSDEALVVAALAITIATQGMGAGVGGSLFSSAVSSMTGGTMVVTSTGMAMASAAFTSVCTQFGTSLLRSGDVMGAATSLFTDQYLRSLGTTLATAGLTGGGTGSIQGFTQRLMVNGLNAVVKAGVSSVIEKRDFGSTLKDAGISAVVESISGSIAEKIGIATKTKINPLSSIENKIAHFALGLGSGAATGALLGHDNILEDALTSGAGAVIGEYVAESLVDREQLMNEARIETVETNGKFDEEYFNATYKAKLQPYVDIGRLVAGSVISATGRDPSLAISAATNALENNFMGHIRIPREIAEGMGDATDVLIDSAVDTYEDIKERPGEYAKEAAIGMVPFATQAKDKLEGKEVTKFDVGLEAVCVASGTNVVRGAGKKVAKTFGAAVVKNLEKKQAKEVLRGTRNPVVKEAARKGREVHAKFAEKVKTKPNWKANQRIIDKRTGKELIPDAVSSTKRPIELKPNTSSGRAKGARQIRKYEQVLEKKGRVIYYEPK
jgi:hypothetical protein